MPLLLMWIERDPIPEFPKDHPREGRRYNPFNNRPSGGSGEPLKNAPEVAPNIDPERPAAVPKSSGHVETEDVENGQRAQSQ